MAMGALLPRTAVRETQDSGSWRSRRICGFKTRTLRAGRNTVFRNLRLPDNGGILATSSVIARREDIGTVKATTVRMHSRIDSGGTVWRFGSPVIFGPSWRTLRRGGGEDPKLY